MQDSSPDFTRDNYRTLLGLAKQHYTFRLYHEFKRSERFLLWRHDVDYSLHASLALARIEAEEGVRATYFIELGCEFYNPFDPVSRRLIGEIKALGHQFGLHFDPTLYAATTQEQLEMHLAHERHVLATITGSSIDVFSFHNPSPLSQSFDAMEYAGMMNAYARYFLDEVGYCSDSNGIWRHRRLEDVLRSGEDRCLQVLTHPAWWTADTMAPRARIFRAIDGRSRYMIASYNAALKASGRDNILELDDAFAQLAVAFGEAEALTLQMHWLRGDHALAFLAAWRLLAAMGVARRGDYGQWEAHAQALLAGETRDKDLLRDGIRFVASVAGHG